MKAVGPFELIRILVMYQASAGSGLQILKPNPEPTVGPGLGLVRLEPGLESQNGNMEMARKIKVSATFSYKICNREI